MDKTININLGGILFKIDEEAFRILRDYLQSINNRFAGMQGGNETIEDIESRIAEIFQSQRGTAGVITKENVEAMISIIGKPEDFEQEEPENKASSHKKRRMYRNPYDKIAGGVCSGIASYLDSDAVLFRILFVIFTFFFGIGILIYLILWIALPVASTESQKRELFGASHIDNQSRGSAQYNHQSRLGNALNEIFGAVGKVFYVVFRIFLIMIGVGFVVTGALSLLTYVMIIIFRYPGVFSIESSGVNFINLQHFLGYIVSPSAIPWILVLASVVLLLPVFALIYWGVKMIVWFKARDGVASMVAFIVWVMAIAALAIIGFNEGVSFAQTGKTSAETILPASPDTLYVKTANKISGLNYTGKFAFTHDDYSVFIDDENKTLYIRPYLDVDKSDTKQTSVEVRKRSTGITEAEAMKKAVGLSYNWILKGDSLKLDEYFTIPSGRKWSADNIGVHLYVPAGTVVKFDDISRILVHAHVRDGSDDYYVSRWESGKGSWKMTDNGLEPVAPSDKK